MYVLTPSTSPLTRLASALSCAATESCAAVVVQGVASMGCCSPGGGCEFFGNCIAYAGYYSSGLCNGDCQSDPNTLKWCVSLTQFGIC